MTAYLEEEGEILIGDVHVRVAALGLVLLHRGLAPAEGVLVDLGLDLLGAVRQEDGGVGVRGGHLGLRPLERDSCDSLYDSLVTAYLERGEEGAVDEGGLEVAEPGRHVTGHPEVGVLVSRVNILIHN